MRSGPLTHASSRGGARNLRLIPSSCINSMADNPTVEMAAAAAVARSPRLVAADEESEQASGEAAQVSMAAAGRFVPRFIARNTKCEVHPASGHLDISGRI